MVTAGAFYLTPFATRQIENVKNEVAHRSDESLISPGVFTESPGTGRIFYAEKVLDNGDLEGVFVSSVASRGRRMGGGARRNADRAPGSTSDTSERFEYRFSDNFSGWKTFTLGWQDFVRRADWQPVNAPNNGLTLSKVWGYNFSPISGSGNFEIDKNKLHQPIKAPTATPQRSPTPQAVSLTLDNFESGDSWTAFNDPNSSLNAQLTSPGQGGQFALSVDANIAANGWGGVEQTFSTPQDWSPYKDIDFWFHGSNSGNPMRLEILDNRQSGSSGDTSERFEYRFNDGWSGWKHIVLSWADFTRRSDWQPVNAPNDGFNRAEIWGLNFSVISGQTQVQLDEIKLSAP